MGDALRDTYDNVVDTKNLSRTLELLSGISAPKIHLLGNHELRAFSREKVLSIYRQYEPTICFQGSRQLDGLTIAWLDLNLNDQDAAYLPESQLAQLPDIAANAQVVFSHYSLVPINARGSFYFENQPAGMHYQNNKKIQESLKKSPATLFINAHVHLLTHQIYRGKQYISNPSFSENIAAQMFTENNPGVYSILETNETQFCFTTYSGDFCFGKIEGTLN